MPVTIPVVIARTYSEEHRPFCVNTRHPVMVAYNWNHQNVLSGPCDTCEEFQLRCFKGCNDWLGQIHFNVLQDLRTGPQRRPAASAQPDSVCTVRELAFRRELMRPQEAIEMEWK